MLDRTASLVWERNIEVKPCNTRDIIFIELFMLKPTNILALKRCNFRHNKHLDTQRTLIRHFTKEAIQMAKNTRERRSRFLVIKEMPTESNTQLDSEVWGMPYGVNSQKQVMTVTPYSGKVYAKLKTVMTLMVFYFTVKYILSVRYPRNTKGLSPGQALWLHSKPQKSSASWCLNSGPRTETFLIYKMGAVTFAS